MKYSLFTKYWRRHSIDELANIVHLLGINNIEMPMRNGYLVEPAQARKILPGIVKRLKSLDINVTSAAGMSGLCDENLIRACADAGVPLLRICIFIEECGYFATVDKIKKGLSKILPLLAKANVKLGIQNHYKSFGSALAIWDIIREFDPAFITAVWDPAHCALAGESPEYSYEILKSHLSNVNLKNAYWTKKGIPDQVEAEWDVVWDTGRKGLAQWPRVAEILKKNNYDGTLCIFAEYTEETNTKAYAEEDIQYAKTLFPS